VTIRRKLIPLKRYVDYLRFQMRLRKAEAEDRNAQNDSSGHAVPPARLRHRVHGKLDRADFLRVGELVAKDIRAHVVRSGRSWESFSDVLDFGCGSARVLQFMLPGNSHIKFYGTDIDEPLVRWCQDNIPGVDWRTNSYMPPTTYADETFDFIYAISVFTHLDESFQDAWLKELARISRRGAILLLSVHGEHVMSYQRFDERQTEQLDQKGFLFVEGVKGRFKLDGLPDFYQNSFHKPEYVERVWGQYFEVIEHIPRGIAGHQDAILLRRA